MCVVCFVCVLLGDVVSRVVFLCAFPNEFVRWGAPLKNQTTKEMCMIGVYFFFLSCFLGEGMFCIFFGNESVRWDAPLKNPKTKVICMIGKKSRFSQTNVLGGMHH